MLRLPEDLSARASITVPRTTNDLLIAQPSFRRSPVAPVYPAFSLPARSTKLMTLNFSILRFSSNSTYRSSIVKIVCARLLVAFIYVAPIDRLVLPNSIKYSISAYELTAFRDNRSTKTPIVLLSRTLSPPCGRCRTGMSRSCTRSL